MRLTKLFLALLVFFAPACKTYVTAVADATATVNTDTTHKMPPTDTTKKDTTVAVSGVVVDSATIARPFGPGCQTVFQLSARVLPANAPQGVSWSATNHGSISITVAGLMTILRAGTDTALAASTSDSTKKARIVVVVNNSSCAPVTGISIILVPDHGSGIKGSTGQITAVVTAPTGVDKSVIWYSTDPSRVDVAQKNGDSITYKGSVILANVKGGTLWFVYPGTAQICAQLVIDPTVRACGQWTTTASP